MASLQTKRLAGQGRGPRGARADYITAEKSVAELDDAAIFARLAPLLS